ncbi:uncharacterized protein LOC108682764 [Hyalella azteca]|uniref:Uncharacterized protein LOC108682764 n=1 Tax=Hyalella azteca TaxID=294128 RepID=A0A8B7PNC7_HYAAZ|nr:uncharacterized protein LOC108682764 [Hyalella azteca]
MEERATGESNKDKKYVLYTVVGDDRPRASPAALLTRVLLSCLLVVALAVVPYVSLRLAQANSRTLVVFQPVPIHNRSAVHRLQSSPTKEVQLMQVADLKLENATLASENDTSASTEFTKFPIVVTNATIVAFLQQNSTTSASTNSTSLEMNGTGQADELNFTSPIPETTLGELLTTLVSSTETTETLTKVSQDLFDECENDSISTSPSSSTASSAATTEVAENTTSIALSSTHQEKSSTIYTLPPSTVSTESSAGITVTVATNISEGSEPIKTSTVMSKLLRDDEALHQKLAYVASSASGNHVGGICVFKVGNNVTDWSYFYENIPIELQSDHANGDHELRATLAAIRAWSSRWHDAHVVIRSPHSAIKESELPLRQRIMDDIESRSAGVFTYELEWRLAQSDALVKISSSLAHLHQDYKFWFQDFQNRVNDMLGVQQWDIVSIEKHIKIPQKAFFDDENLDTDSKPNIVPSKISNATVTEISEASGSPTRHPLSHKLVYMATAASGNHVGGFCVWKYDKNVTDWSYFYDNVPVELQSSHDSEDHEVRAALAGVRVWADRWTDAHVSLRSQRSPLLRSHTATFFLQTLDARSTSQFSYDLEWQLRKSEDLMRVAYSLSRLYRNFGHWFTAFKVSVDAVVGPQDWNIAAKAKRVHLNDEHFFVDPVFPEAQPSEMTKIE